MSKLLKMKSTTEKYSGEEREVHRYLLQDVWFYYLQTAPRIGDGKKWDKHFPAKDCSYGVSILAEDGKKLFKEFTKSKSNPEAPWDTVKVEEVEREDFEDKFGCEPPFEAETYYLLKVNRAASYRDGTVWAEKQSFTVSLIEQLNGKNIAVKQPMRKVKAAPSKDHIADKNYDVTHPDIMIGNGSKGSVILETHFYTFKNQIMMKPVQSQFIISNLVEYVRQERGAGNVELEDDALAALGLDGVDNSAEIIERQLESSDKGSDKTPAKTNSGELVDPDEDEDEDEEGDAPFETE